MSEFITATQLKNINLLFHVCYLRHTKQPHTTLIQICPPPLFAYQSVHPLNILTHVKNKIKQFEETFVNKLKRWALWWANKGGQQIYIPHDPRSASQKAT